MECENRRSNGEKRANLIVEKEGNKESAIRKAHFLAKTEVIPSFDFLSRGKLS